MKNFILLILTLLLAQSSFSAHIVGGEISYECLGNDEYKVTVKVFRDANSGGAVFDNPLLLFVYDGVTNQLLSNLSQSLNYGPIPTLPVIFNNPCVNPPSDISIQRAIYEKTITLPANSNGYTLVYQRCCRGGNITNLLDPATQGLTLTAFIPGTNSGITCNSSPSFSNYPPLVLCANEELIFDHSATDSDGDSLVYEICAPYLGGTSTDPAPNPASNPPYPFVNYGGGYNSVSPLGAGANLQIDPNTGLLTANPQIIGLYAVGICVHEYRNGQYISTNRRDFLFRATSCDVQLNATVTDQVDLVNFISFCQGLTIQFENESLNLSTNPSYFWDFGVSGTLSDTSNLFAPSFTFPAEGLYTVTLILNPGLSCSDTTSALYIVYENFDVNIANDGPQCITGNSFNFSAFGDFNDSTTYSWDFGPNASISLSSDSIVNGIVFNTTGYIPIVFVAEKAQCVATLHDTILVYQEPTIGFYLEDSLMCVPFTANFLDSSFATTPITYLWDFGNGQTSTDQNPSIIYSNVGSFDVSLQISTDSGCITTLNLIKPGFINVFPSPTAGISSDKIEVSPYDPYIEFYDDSFDHSSIEIHVDSTISITAPYVHGFIQSGFHYPYIVAYNLNGCTDTAWTEIFVTPSQSIFIPNAFTPNGDGKNDFFMPGVLDVLSFEFRVFNRFGKVVFESSTYGESWDGTFKGKKSQDGVYVYQLKYIDLDKLPFEKYGHITLLR